jgi:putative SOS response-associated peptidase YedK
VARRRCLLPADGYYEWYPTEQLTNKGKPVKQPFFITPRDGGILAMAGLYEIWRDESVPEDQPGAFVWSATVITTSAEDSLGHIHDRMPMLVEPDSYDRWLDASVTAVEHVTDVLIPAAPGRLTAYPVSKAVNDHRNNGHELVEAVALEGEPAGLFAP